MSDSSRPHGLQPTRLLHPWDFPGKSTGVGCHHLLGIVPPGKPLIRPYVYDQLSLTGYQDNSVGEIIAFSTSGARTTAIYIQKNEVGLLNINKS